MNATSSVEDYQDCLRKKDKAFEECIETTKIRQSSSYQKNFLKYNVYDIGGDIDRKINVKFYG